jgi:hypothetical protein
MLAIYSQHRHLAKENLQAFRQMQLEYALFQTVSLVSLFYQYVQKIKGVG